MTNAIHRRILAFALAIAVMIAFTPAIAFTQSASAATRPGKVLWSSITKTPTTVTLKWQKASKAKGYSVYQKKSGKYKKIKTTTKRTYTTKKLKAFKSYSFKVRAYRMSGGKKVYGKYSSAKKVTTAASKITGVTITSSASSVSAGSNVTFTATVTGGTKPLKYQWYKDGVLIEGATESTYTAALGSSDSGAKFTCKVTGPDGKSLTSEEAGSVTVYNTVTRTVVKSWNIGSDTAGNNYTGSNGTDKVVATLYSDGELAVTGTGDTVAFDYPTRTGSAPWSIDKYKTQVKSSKIVSTVKPTDMSHWYSGCSNLTMTPMIPSSVEKMQFTFADCTSLTNAPDLTGCTSLTDMTASFYYCTSLTDMSSYMISAGVKNMSQTFQGCTKLTTAPTIPSSVENMGSTFQGCTSLTTAPTIPSSVTEMTGTFNGCSALTGTMLIKASPTSGNYSNCFGGASTNTGTDLKVTCMKSKLTAVTGIVNTKSTNSNIALGNPTWNIGAASASVNYTGSNGTSSVVATLYSDGELDITGTGNTVVFGDATSTSGTGAYQTPWNLAGKASAITSATIASGVTPTNMGRWYEGCAITAAPAIPSSVKNMDSTFQDCGSLTTAPDISGCTQLTNMYETFDGCTALTTAPTIPSNVENMAYTFNGCTALTAAPAIPSRVTNMRSTFQGCTSLTTAPNISGCTNLTNMNDTFNGCTALTTAPTIPSSVTDMESTFSACRVLTGTMQINANPSYGNYNLCFGGAATSSAGLTVNYTSANASIIDAIIATQGTGTGVKKGSLVTP